MRSQPHSNLRFIHHGVAAMLSMALHVGIIQWRLSIPPPPATPQGKTPSLAIPQQAVQVRPRPPEQSLDVAPPPPTPPAPAPSKPPAPTKPPLAAQTSARQPAPSTSVPPINNSVAVEPEVQSKEPKTPPKPPQQQPKLMEENPPADDQPDIEPDSAPEPEPEPETSPSPEQSIALKWDGLISNIQAGESGFGQTQSLQDIFLLFGQDKQVDLFFDPSDQPKFEILSYQLFTDLTAQQVWEEKILPTLEKQDSIEITEDQIFASGKVYRISQGEFVRYLNVVPLYQPQEVVLLEMAEPPSKEN